MFQNLHEINLEFNASLEVATYIIRYADVGKIYFLANSFKYLMNQ